MITYILNEEQKQIIIDFDCVFAPIKVDDVYHLLIDSDYLFDDYLSWVLDCPTIN